MAVREKSPMRDGTESTTPLGHSAQCRFSTKADAARWVTETRSCKSTGRSPVHTWNMARRAHGVGSIRTSKSDNNVRRLCFFAIPTLINTHGVKVNLNRQCVSRYKVQHEGMESPLNRLTADDSCQHCDF